MGRDPDFERLAVARELAFVLARAARSTPDAVEPSLGAVLGMLDAATDGEDRTHEEYLLDILDVLGRAEPSAVAAMLCDRFEVGPEAAVPAMSGLYRLEHRYATDDHPVLEHRALRAAVEEAIEADDPDVRAAAREVDTVHGFHRG